MNFLIFLIITLVLVGIALLTIGINLLLGRKNTLKYGSCGNDPSAGQKDSGCGCGAASCCAENK